MSDVADGVRLRTARAWLLRTLLRWGVDEAGQLIVAQPRSVSSDAGARLQRRRLRGSVGYYSAMSQYRSRIRIVVVVAQMRRDLDADSACGPGHDRLQLEIERTVAHEYGHVMAEAIRVEAGRSNAWDVPAWPSNFDGDEETFAEDFARFLTGAGDCDGPFWSEFMVRYAREWRRTFCEPTAATPIALARPA